MFKQIKIYNENRLTRQPFFKLLIAFLMANEDVNLRQIHRAFDAVEENLDRQLDKYIKAGLIIRQDRRYRLGGQIFGDDDIDWSALTSQPAQRNYFVQPFFVRADSHLAQRLDETYVYQELRNETNSVVLHLTSRFDCETDTLANYFFKISENLNLSPLEREVYQIMGDADPEYVLKYMTTFLLKFKNKKVVKKHPDIFVRVLEKYGYINASSENEFTTNIVFSEQEIPRVDFDDAEMFIKAQLTQQTNINNFISLDKATNLD